MKYRFTIDEATEPPTKPEVVFRAKSVERAYRFVVSVIINDERNKALRAGTLYKEGAFGWEVMMIWKRGPGWRFADGHTGVVDNRIAPGA